MRQWVMKKVVVQCFILGMCLGSAIPSWAYDSVQLAQLKTTKQCPNCDLSRADLQDQDLTGANLTQAFLGGSNLFEAQLQGANLSGADLRVTNLFHANLTSANQQDMNLTGAHRFQTLGLLSP